MQITLTEAEITAAVDAFVRTQIVVADGQDISIDFKNGRGEYGLTATLEIKSAAAPAIAAAVEAKPVGVAPEKPAAKPDLKPEPVADKIPEETADAAEPDAKEEWTAESIFDKAG